MFNIGSGSVTGTGRNLLSSDRSPWRGEGIKEWRPKVGSRQEKSHPFVVELIVT
jgi:hypothetical protein